MNPPWGINWQRYHADQQDMPHIERMGYASFTIYEWMWSNRDFCNELLSVARQDAIFLNRDHPLSEQKDDLWKSDPAQKGRNHADEWAQKVREGKVYTPLDRTYFLGLNEPDSNHWQRQIDAYNEAYCRRMAEHGLRAAAYSFGVGHPSTVGLQPDTLPDWSWYAASAAAVLEGDHIAAFHEYGEPDNYGWGHWCNRVMHCPYPFNAVLDECGIDHGVLRSGYLYGWAIALKPEEYAAWLDNMQAGYAERAHTRKVKLLGYNIFGYDHGTGDTKDWHSFDIRPLRALLEQWPWQKVASSPRPVVTHIPSVGTGSPSATPVPPLAHPLGNSARRVVSQGFGDNPQDYARFGLAGHNGVDFAVPSGTPIGAVDSGVVMESQLDADGYGEYIKLRHSWGESLYAHLSARKVEAGEPVNRGSILGRSGNTGNSTGPHLHFAMRVNPYTRGAPFDGFVDPLRYLDAAQPTPQPTVDVLEAIEEAANEFGIEWQLLASQAWAESSFDPKAISRAGAKGLFQIMPATWDEWAPKVGASNPFDAVDSARVGAAYMQWLLQQTQGNAWRALVAYGWGIGNVITGEVPPATWIHYANKVVHGRDLLKAVEASQ